jgi:hypothetical protein
MILVARAAKMEENDARVPSVYELNRCCQGSYSTQLIVKMESLLLDLLDWNLVVLTPRHFLGATGEYYAQHALSEMYLVGCCVERHPWKALVCALEASKGQCSLATRGLAHKWWCALVTCRDEKEATNGVSASRARRLMDMLDRASTKGGARKGDAKQSQACGAEVPTLNKDSQFLALPLRQTMCIDMAWSTPENDDRGGDIEGGLAVSINITSRQIATRRAGGLTGGVPQLSLTTIGLG